MSLLNALDQGDNEEVQKILHEHPEDVQMRDEDERVAMHYAASRSDVTTLKLIYIEDRSLVDASDKNELTPLLCALQDGRTDSAEFLAKNGANVNHVDIDGRNAVHWTVVCGQLEALNWAIGKNVDINLKDNLQQCTPLHYSTSHEDMPPEVGQAVLITLLRHGADANCMDTDNRTPMHWCAANGNLDAMTALYNAGGDLCIKDKDLLSVLHCAASHGYHEMIEYCIGKVNKSMIDESDRAGHTALFYAVSFGHYESALKLLQHGANPNHQDQRLRTASHSAASRGQMRMLKLLRHYNASFDIQNYRGDTPFHEAVQSGSKDVVEWLLAMDGSVLDTPNHNGRTGLHLAAAAGNIEMVIILCTKKCFVDPLMSVQQQVFTPLDLATEQQHQVVVEYLRGLCGAKKSSEFTPEYIEQWKLSFETIVAEAKKKRDRQLSERKRRDRRPSTTDGVVESAKHREIVDVGVNTTGRGIKSADSAARRKCSKSTSVTNLMQVPSVPEQELEALRASIENGQKLVDEEENEDHVDILDVDEEFENLPPISDLSESSSLDTSASDHNDSDDSEKSDSEAERKITVREANAEAPPSSMKKSEKKTKKEVRIESGSGGHRKKRSSTEKPHHGHLVMRVRREPEIGSDGGDVDIYDDGDGQPSDDEEKRRQPSSLTNKRYIHEKAIFQELTHLKRMQIQYGKVVRARREMKALCRNHDAFSRGHQVQERVLVRSLISNFCKMHNLDVRNFKFQTFYAWEKFLYDALSEQLKIIYLEERERISETNSEAKPTTSTMKLNKFDSKIRNSMPASEKMRDMQRIYSHSTISHKSSRSRPTAAPKESSRKRCDCLDKHLFL